jgi:hypothetical protein
MRGEIGLVGEAGDLGAVPDVTVEPMTSRPSKLSFHSANPALFVAWLRAGSP